MSVGNQHNAAVNNNVQPDLTGYGLTSIN